MGAHSARTFTVGLMLAAVGLLSACSVQPAASAPAAGAPPVVTVTAPVVDTMPMSSPMSSLSPQPASSGTFAGGLSAGTDGEPVNCGKVGPTGGAQVDLLAESTKAGIVGCTEAINVITDYYRDAPTKSEGTAHFLVVDGWTCLADTGAFGSGAIGCDKDGFAFRTQP